MNVILLNLIKGRMSKKDNHWHCFFIVVTSFCDPVALTTKGCYLNLYIQTPTLPYMQINIFNHSNTKKNFQVCIKQNSYY